MYSVASILSPTRMLEKLYGPFWRKMFIIGSLLFIFFVPDEDSSNDDTEAEDDEDDEINEKNANKTDEEDLKNTTT